MMHQTRAIAVRNPQAEDNLNHKRSLFHKVQYKVETLCLD